MEAKELLLAVLRLPHNELSLFHVVVSDKLDRLEVESTVLASSKKRAEQVTLAFSEEGMSLTPSKRGGNGPSNDPQSALGKVRTAVLAIMNESEGKPVVIRDFYPRIMKETGLALGTIKANQGHVPGIKRNWGVWTMRQTSLTATI